MPGYVNRAAWWGSFFAPLVPFRYCTVGTPEGKEVEAEARVKEWQREDRVKQLEKEHSKKQLSSMTGASLEELSTRETEMSIHETSFMAEQRSRAQSRNTAMQGSPSTPSSSGSSMFGSFGFFQSLLVKPAAADDGSMDAEDDVNGSGSSDEGDSAAKTHERKSKRKSKRSASGQEHHALPQHDLSSTEINMDEELDDQEAEDSDDTCPTGREQEQEQLFSPTKSQGRGQGLRRRGGPSL